MRKGRFKKHLVDEQTLVQESESIFPKIETLIKFKELFKWSNAEFCLAYILIYLDARGKSILGGGRSKKIKVELFGQFYISQLSDLLSKPLKKDFNQPAINILNTNTLRGMPESINDVLLSWHQQLIELELYHYIPTPKEVLQSQKDGSRCVTMAIKKNQLKHYLINSRDPLGFLVHDLEHAAQFFLSPYKEGQIHFYQKISEVVDQIQSEFNDEIFKDEFDYVISDMNSHPEHLKQYLKAKMINFNIRNNKPSEQGLEFYLKNL